jgi:hypothetical protein
LAFPDGGTTTVEFGGGWTMTVFSVVPQAARSRAENGKRAEMRRIGVSRAKVAQKMRAVS